MKFLLEHIPPGPAVIAGTSTPILSTVALFSTVKALSPPPAATSNPGHNPWLHEPLFRI